MLTKPPVEFHTDDTRNIFHMRFRGQVTAAGLAAELPEAQRRLTAMPAGFHVLTDLSDLEAMELDCVTALTQMMDHIRTQRPALIVRVIPDPDKDIGFNILSIIHYRGAVRIVTCATLEEATRALRA